MISLVVVNYRTAAMAAEAVRSAREASSSPLQVVIVDNSEDPREADALRGIADELIVSDRNRGYAGGANLGRRACSGETIVLANPDVVFDAEAIDHLHAALAKAAVAGPALFWDAAQTWHLPPGDLTTGTGKLDEVLASRTRSWFEVRDRRRFRRRVAFWSLRKTTPVRMLSGAVMAIRAADLDRAGGFDERFRLYFEETDLLRRMGELHNRIVYVPAARCRHLYNQSAAQVPAEAASRFAESEILYLEKWSGPFAARLLKRLERSPQGYEAASLQGGIEIDGKEDVVEASPLATFATAAGHFPRGAGTVTLPAEVTRSVAGELYVRVVSVSTGRPLRTYKIEP